MPLQPKEQPNQETLSELLRYDPQSGNLYWLPRATTTKANRVFNKTFAGKVAGNTSVHGYIIVEIFGKAFKAHRIIWKLVTGRDPPEWIDHRDSNRANNRWENLREATQSQNSYNGNLSPRNTSGFRCVSFIRSHGKFRAAIQIDGEKKHIGYFVSAKEAHLAAADAIYKTRGEFARV